MTQYEEPANNAVSNVACFAAAASSSPRTPPSRSPSDSPIKSPLEVGSRCEPVRLLAPAKLTLRLRITGVRCDGYHFIDAEMVTLDLCDELIVYPISGSPTKASSVEVVPVANCSSASAWDIPSDESNLVMRALALAGRTAQVEIRKRIPPGAGLGGGSADAAAVLRWANRLAIAEAYESSASGTTPEPRVVDVRQAATLGADVAFCLLGGRARVTGIGEIVTPLPFRKQSFVLWTPPIQVDTAAVYRRWDELGGPSGAANDLESAACSVHPELASWRAELARISRRTPRLAGSGSTWFVTAPFGADVFAQGSDSVGAVSASAIGRL